MIRAGYSYRVKRKNKDDTILWRCVESKCYAVVKTINETSSVIISETPHNHEANYATCEIKKHMNTINEKVAHDLMTPVAQIYEDVTSKIQDAGLDKVTKISSFENVKKKLYRKRYKALGIKNISYKRAVDVVIPNKFKNMLIADYTEKNTRILVFSCPELKTWLSKGKMFYIDGTFKSCQRNFYQLVTLHVDLGSDRENIKVVPILYALLPNKNKQTYSLLFRLIKSQATNWNPINIKVDFEISLMSAIIDTCPGVEIQGCYYHFTKCLWRKARQCGLQKTRLGKVHIKRLSALAHLPFEELLDAWLFALDKGPKTKIAKSFNEYFYKTWMDPKSIYFGRWTCHNQVNRTNNAIEGWHSKVNKLLKPKPNIIQLLVIMQRMMKNDVEKIRKNEFSKRKSEIMEVNDHISETVLDLKNKKISLDFCIEHLRM